MTRSGAIQKPHSDVARTTPDPPLARAAKRLAIASIGVSAALAALKISVGLRAGSTAVVSDGFESASDVLTSSLVLIGLTIASRPPDYDHPYGHGRFEILTALSVGAILAATGALIAFHAVERAFEPPHPLEFFAVWPLLISIICKSTLWASKRVYGRRLRSASLEADASNDAMDVLSAVVALVGLSISLYDPARFAAFDHAGGVGVGAIVVALGLRVIRGTVLELMDTMPNPGKLGQIRKVALEVPGALGVEKCLARKTGLKYHVDLHLEVDPNMTVRDSHEIATQVRIRIKETLDWVADVLVHVEPYGVE